MLGKCHQECFLLNCHKGKYAKPARYSNMRHTRNYLQDFAGRQTIDQIPFCENKASYLASFHGDLHQHVSPPSWQPEWGNMQFVWHPGISYFHLARFNCIPGEYNMLRWKNTIALGYSQQKFNNWLEHLEEIAPRESESQRSEIRVFVNRYYCGNLTIHPRRLTPELVQRVMGGQVWSMNQCKGWLCADLVDRLSIVLIHCFPQNWVIYI